MPRLLDYDIDLRQASLLMRMPEPTVLKCIRYRARPNGGISLACRDYEGMPYFRRSDIDAYLVDIGQSWVDDPKEKRPNIPSYFENYLQLETELRCGRCDAPTATEIAHIVPWASCHHHHPWNLLCVCVKCHTGYDIEKRISQEEMQRAKDHAVARFADVLREPIRQRHLLEELRNMAFKINGVDATGIDVLVSTLMLDEAFLHFTKLRLVSMYSIMGDGALASDPVAALNFATLVLSRVGAYRIADPFWDRMSRTVHEMKLFPDGYITLTLQGEMMMEHLVQHAEDFFNPIKYPAYRSLAPRDALRRIAEELQRIQERRDKNLGRMDDLELNSFDT